MKKTILRIFSLVLLMSLMVSPVIAQSDDGDPRTKGLGEPEIMEPILLGEYQKVDSFIVLLEDDSLITYKGEVPGFPATSPTETDGELDIESIPVSNYLGYLKKKQDAFIATAGTTIGRDLDVTFRYDVILNGFAAKMSPEEAKKLAALDGVKAVYADQIWEIDTDVSPGYLGADTLWTETDSTPGTLETMGEGMLIGVLDTGINLDHPSFADIGGDGYDHDNPFGAGNYVGLCATDPTNYICNDKLVGVYSYITTEEPLVGEDNHAHGSHTASTAAGNVLDLDYNGIPVTISGMAPHANIIAYDVCYTNPDGTGGCPNSYSVAAVQQAVLDGVDVLNYSIGPSAPVNPYGDAVSMAMLEAVDAGVLTSTSAGNDGPDPSTIYKAPAWNLNVANITHGRIFGFPVDVHDVSGPLTLYDAVALPGTGLLFTSDLVHNSLKWAGDDDPGNFEGCSPFSANFFDGAVALISRGACSFADKIDNAAAAGALATLVYNNAGGPPIVMGGCEATTIPSAMLDKEDGEAIVGLMTPSMLVSIGSDQVAGTKAVWADIVADGSSRGPYELLDILTPDVGAPGTNVLAAYNTPGATPPFGGTGPAEIDLMSGTSMASPHGAGSALLLMDLFPSWTPMEIKSAIMMSAYNDTMVKEDGVTPADPFDTGNGRIDLTKAALIGLVMDETVANFEAADPALGGDVKTLNIPSYQNSQCVGNCSFSRTVKNVADTEVEYTVSVDLGPGLAITVSPSTFTLAPGATQTVDFEIDVSGAEMGTWVFISATFTTEDTFTSGEAITDARFQMAVMPDAGNLPGLIEKEVYRDAGGVLLDDLYSIEITDLTVETAGLTEATLYDFELAGDPTNGDAFDDLDDVWFRTFDIPAGTKRIVMEILETTASDLDLFFGFGATPSAASLWDASASGTAYEYISWVDPIDYNWWVVVQNWGGDPEVLDEVTFALAMVPDEPSTNFDVSGPSAVPAITEFDLEVTWDIPEMEALSAWYGWFNVGSDPGNPGNIGETELNVYRPYDDVVKEVSKDPTENGDVVTYTITVAPNETGEELDYVIHDVLPDGVTYVDGSLATGGSSTPATYDDIENAVHWEGTMPKIEYTYLMSDNTTNPYCDTPFGGYVDILTTFGYPTSAGLEGDSYIWQYTSLGAGTEYFGEAITETPAFTTDGYVYMNGYDDWWFWTPQYLPDPTIPNGILAEWMTDSVVVYDEPTNKGVTGVSFDGGVLWLVEFDDVEDWYDPSATMDYQIWAWQEVDPSEGWPDIMIAYDNVVNWGPYGVVGLENSDGTVGTTYAYGDYVPSNGDVVCFDYTQAGADPVVITFDVLVETIEETLITNTVDHLADGLGMLEEQASASFTNYTQVKPVADPQSLTTEEETPLAITLTGSYLEPGPVTWEVVKDPMYGTLSGTAPDLVYTPDTDFYGMDEFDFIVNDGLEDSNPATVVIEVMNVNDAPLAGDDYYEVDQDFVLDVSAPGVMENDYDADPTDDVFVEMDEGPEHGTLVLNRDGSFTYTPDAGYFGSDSFTYILMGIPEREEFADYATVYITVHPFMEIFVPIFNN